MIEPTQPAIETLRSDLDVIVSLLRAGDDPERVALYMREHEESLSELEADLRRKNEALREIVMAEPDETPARIAWPSFAGALQNIAAIALAPVSPSQPGTQQGGEGQ